MMFSILKNKKVVESCLPNCSPTNHKLITQEDDVIE